MSQHAIDAAVAYNWLNKFEEEGVSFLRNSVQNLLAQIADAVNKRNFTGAVNLIDIVIKVSESTGKSLEQAETHFRCGYAFYQMERYKKAITEYRQAKIYYDIMHLHNQAITNWMLGYALWKIMKPSHAIVEWEQSYQRFQILKEVALEQKEGERAEWYGEIGAVMCSDLAKAIENGHWSFE